MFDIQIMMDDMSFLIKKLLRNTLFYPSTSHTKYESHQNDETFTY